MGSFLFAGPTGVGKTEVSVSRSDRDTLKNLGDRLKMLVFGQDKAIEALTEAIKMRAPGWAMSTSRWDRSCSPGRPGSGKPK